MIEKYDICMLISITNGQEVHTHRRIYAKMKSVLDTAVYKQPKQTWPHTQGKGKNNHPAMVTTGRNQGKSHTTEKSSWIPRIYGLSKIHKLDCPPRSIVSFYNSPTHPLVQQLASYSNLQQKTQIPTSETWNIFSIYWSLSWYTIQI